MWFDQTMYLFFSLCRYHDAYNSFWYTKLWPCIVALFGKHFDRNEWDAWTGANDTENGTCYFCGVEMGPDRGIPKHQRLHILRRCPKYRLQSESETRQPDLPVPGLHLLLQLQHHRPLDQQHQELLLPPPSQRWMIEPDWNQSQWLARRRKVRSQNKSWEYFFKLGTCTHEVVFGQHFKR